ncbi:MAG TPA: hypothetical protein VFR67_06415 [Pilimelia sp.]|nr:hypothetical protein [Pilimelia sp.]
MGTRNGGDGDNRPPDGVPGLPPEWGLIVVPDDPAELSKEAADVRRELRREARQQGQRRRLWWPLSRRSASSSIEAAMVIVGIAILATLTSLFVIAWPQTPRLTPPPSGAARTAPPPGARTVPALDLLDSSGTAVPVRGLLPAVILVIEDCTCASLIAATAAAAPPEVNVVVVGASAPPLPEPTPPRVRALADPAGGLRSLAPGPLRGTAAVLLVNRDADIVRTVPAAGSTAPYEADLATLAAR